MSNNKQQLSTNDNRKPRQNKHQHEVQAAISAYQSPLPPAPVLREYEELLPGTMDRILKLTEQQQIHRHKWELKELDNNIREGVIGRIFGLLVLGMLLIGAFYFGFKGMEILASCFLGTAALGIIPRFIKGIRSIKD